MNEGEQTLLTADADVRERLEHVYWIGGAPGAGKSTIARRLASQYGFQLYATDDVMSDHARRTTPAGSPYLTKFMSMDMDERWLNRTPGAMLETFHWFRGEGFSLIVEDLLVLPQGSGVIAEGFRLLPHLVEPLLTERWNAVWLLPTPDFAQKAFECRDAAWSIAGKTSDPARARENLVQRDRMFTDRLREDTKRLGLATVEVDVPMTDDEVATKVTRALRLGLDRKLQ